MAIIMRVFVILLFVALAKCTALNQRLYEVHWLSDSISIDREKSGFKKNIDIFCYPGIEKNLAALWQTVKVNIILKNLNDDFKQYFGSSPEEVYEKYNENNYGWSVLQRKPSRSTELELFNTTCVNFDTKDKHVIQLQVIRIDLWRILLMAAGIATIFCSKAFSGNHIFYYLCGVFIGIFASFMVIVYFIGKRLPQRGITYGIMIGGWTFGVYLFQKIWENLSSIIIEYQAAMFWYIAIVGFVSFTVCYKLGPPNNPRSQNIIMWTLQFIGATMIFFSSQYREASTAVCMVALCIKYLPKSWIRFFTGFWRKRFPPKVKLLTSEEYYEQGARETKDALDNLRKYCSSPDCAQWRVILKLNDSKRFASFVEGNSHLSDDEIVDYESYAFSMQRKRDSMVNSTTNQLEISDDETSSDEDL